jgi:complement component 1 Q subcomponent-binding protein, mitochondrial
MPVVLDSKVNGKKKKGSGAGKLSGALDVEIREAQESLDSDE